MPHNGINKGRKRLFKQGLTTMLLRITVPTIREEEIRKSVEKICKADYKK